MRKRVLGLDLGIGSLGWAVVDLDEELLEQPTDKNNKIEAKYKISNGKIIGAGVRIFDEPVDRQGKSLAASRGEARRGRATIERKAERLRYLINLAKQYGIISQSFTVDEFDVPKKIELKDWNIWKLRSEAPYIKLSSVEIFRILYHIANHRGFYFPTKAEAAGLDDVKTDNLTGDDAKVKEDKKIKGGIISIKNAYKSSGCKTIGEYLYKKEGKKHNKKDDYSVSLYRDDLRDEVKTILKFQREHGNSVFTQEFEDRYINEVLMYNHQLEDDNIKKMIGKCELIPSQLRFPKHGYEAELFTFYNRVNNLVICNDKNKDRSQVKHEETENKIDNKDILNYVLNCKSCKLTFSDLRKFLNLSSDERFNLCSYHEFNPEYEKTIKIEKNKIDEFNADNLKLYNVATGEEKDSCWQGLKTVVEQYFERYDNAKSVKYYFSDIRKQLNIAENLRFCK